MQQGIGAARGAAANVGVEDAMARPPQELEWLRRAIDCVDYAMVCIAPDQRVCAANRAAREELAEASHPLQLLGSTLRPRLAADVGRLQRAMHEAQTQGKRRLLMLGSAPSPLSVAVLPLGSEDGVAPGVAPAGTGRVGMLLVFGKRRLCESLSTDWFARERGLTWAETRVLQGLTSGLRPIEIAQRQGVALSTVRSQVRSLRAKTGAASIGALLGQVSSLPPMLNTLRCTGP